MKAPDESRPRDPPLRELLAAAKSGDLAARDELLRRVLPTLRAFVRRHAGRRLREREECSDVVQAICHDLIEGLDRIEYRGDAAFQQWLRESARHKIFERLRYWNRVKRAGEPVELPADETLEPDLIGRELLAACSTFLTPAQESIVREDRRLLDEAFARLPPDQRRVVILHRIAGVRHKEVAKELGRSEGATRQLLARALRQLARDLDPRTTPRSKPPRSKRS